MNYNIFTKSELIEAIKKSRCNCFIDDYLLAIWNEKMKENIAKQQELGNKIFGAKDLKQIAKIKEEIAKNEKEYKRLKKVVD